jgi:uridine phosphorylase
MLTIRDKKSTSAPSVFRPSALLREARRQKGLVAQDVPTVCVLDPDGDIVRHLIRTNAASRSADWACYHTELYTFTLAGETAGIVGCAVGAPFAVLVAEELFASGCRLLISLTSAGQIVPAGDPPYFVIIDRALRDEGTSHHYLPPSEFSEADGGLIDLATRALQKVVNAAVGASWTTDAPFRETADAIGAARMKGVLAVEMESAGLYAFARASGNSVVCLAHVTNSMGQAGDDFEKGEANGSVSSLAVLGAIADAFRRRDGA